MKKVLRFPCILLLIAFCISVCTIGVYATDGEGEDYGDDIIVDDPGTEYVEPETEAPYVEPETEAPYVEPETEAPYVEPETEAPYVEPQDDNNYDDNNYQEEYVDYYHDDNSDEFQDFNDNSAETAAPTEAVYDVKDKKKSDLKTLEDEDWEEIKESLKDSAGSGSSDDFAWIQENESKEDDGQEFIILGIALVVLGAGGLIAVGCWYYIRYKNIKSGKVPVSAKAKAAPSKPNQRPPFPPPPAKGKPIYNNTTKRQVKKRSKYDTGEINIPKQNNGRYKPRH